MHAMEPVRRAVIVTHSTADTEAAGAAMAARLTGGACVVLVGGLGAGKTAFVRGACRGLGVSEEVLSPTFILMESFDGRLPVVHLDLYRLEHEEEIEALGVFDLLGGDGVLLVEWGDRSPTLTENADVVVEIGSEDAGHPDRRRIVFSWTNEFDAMLGKDGSWL
jgi:tRNA threonylcarbamoyladenosine biosynthesis protein TsaE